MGERDYTSWAQDLIRKADGMDHNSELTVRPRRLKTARQPPAAAGRRRRAARRRPSAPPPANVYQPAGPRPPRGAHPPPPHTPHPLLAQTLELETFGTGTEHELFCRWLTENRGHYFKLYDADKSGTLGLPELKKVRRAGYYVM